MLPFRPIEQLIGLGLAATAAAGIAPYLGMLTQRYITTSIPFNLAVENITIARDFWGKESHFVKVSWEKQELINQELINQELMNHKGTKNTKEEERRKKI